MLRHNILIVAGTHINARFGEAVDSDGKAPFFKSV